MLLLGVAGAMPAHAAGGVGSNSFQFIEAVEKRDGTKVENLLKTGSKIVLNTHKDGTGEGALHIVIKRRDTEWLEYFLAKGADANIDDAKGNTPLMLAAQIGYPDAANLLLAKRHLIPITG